MPNTWSDFAQRASNGAHEPVVHDQLDGLAKIAARVLEAPVALISLTTNHHNVVVGQVGLDIDQITHRGSLWSGVVAEGACLIVHDARHDARFAADPMVIGPPYIRFFAGLPLLGSDGTLLGALCVIDSAPRGWVSSQQLDDLQTLAKATTACLERWRIAEIESGRQTMPPGTHGTSRRFETLADALPQLVWSTASDGQSDYFSQQWCEFTGAPASTSYGAGWFAFVHPEDVPGVREAWRTAVDSGQPYTAEFRLLNADGSYRWMLSRGLPVTDEFGRITRWVGTCTDIDERVRTGDLMEFMSRELSHRIKNLFSVVQGLISMALRKHPGMSQVSQSLQSRMVALGRAHDLVRPRIFDGSIFRSETTLQQLIQILTLPYVEEDPSRLEIHGDDAVVSEQAATPLALFFHEMAMNSAKFGALSVPQGRLEIAISLVDDVTVVWKERGGPVIDAAPEAGFGLGLTKLGIERQLGGTLTMDWQHDGLYAVARIATHQLTAD
jgi:PAS domain S-box-containing protein